MSSLGRFGADFGDSFPNARVEVGYESDGDLRRHSVPGKPSFLLIDGSDGADGFGSNAGPDGDVGPSMAEGNGRGDCYARIGVENELSNSVHCNGCGNVVEMSCPSISSNGNTADHPDGFGLNVVVNNDHQATVIGRNEMEDDGFGIGNQLCPDQVETGSRIHNLVQCNGVENISLADGKSDTLSGLNGFHMAAASEDDVEPLVTRSRTEDGCGDSGLSSNESGIEKRLQDPVQRKGCEKSSETACIVMDGNGEGGQARLCSNPAPLDDEGASVIGRNELKDGCGDSGLCSNKSDMEDRLCSSVQCNGCENVLETACTLIEDNVEDGQDEFCVNVASVNGSDAKCCSCSSVRCYGCEDASATTCHSRNSCVNAMNRPSGIHFNVASNGQGELSSSESNRTGEECGFNMLRSPEFDMENQFCNSLQWDKHENLSETFCPLINSKGDGDVPDVFYGNNSSENDAGPLIIVNKLDDAHRAGELCSNKSDEKNVSCTSLQGNGCGNISETSFPFVGSSGDAVDGLSKIDFGVVSENYREPLTIGRNQTDAKSGFSIRQFSESSTDNLCNSLHYNRCEALSEMSCSLNSTVDTLDGPSVGPHFKVASGNNTEPWNIGNDRTVVCGASSLSSNENDIVSQLCMLGSMQDGPSPEKDGSGTLEDASCNEEMLLPSLVQQNQQMEKHVFGTLEETVTGLKGAEHERSHIEASTPIRLTTGTPHAEENPSDSIEGHISSSHCSMEELTLPHYQHLLELGHIERDASSAVGSSEPADNQVKVDAKLDCVSRNTSSGKSTSLSRTRKAARQYQQAANTIGVFLNNAKRKRSYCGKQGRSSIWGSMGNIIQVFMQNDEIPKFDSKLTKMQNRGSKKARGGSGRRRRQKTRNSGRGSQVKGRTSTNRVRLKVKKEEEGSQRSLEAVLPEVVDSSASVQTVNDCSPESDCCAGFEIPRSASEVGCKLGGDGCGVQETPCINQNLKKLESPVDMPIRDAQHGEKDMESTVTQDTSIENTSGADPGVSSRIETEALDEAVLNMHSDRGTTPVTAILHVSPATGISSSEGAVYTRRKALSDGRVRPRNGIIADSRVQEAFHDSVLTPPEASSTPVNVMPSNTNHTSREKGKTCGVIKRGPNQFAGSFSAKEKLHCPANSNEGRKSMRSRPVGRVAGNSNHMDAFNMTTSENASTKVSSIGAFTMKSPLSDAAEEESCQGNTDDGMHASSGQDVWISQPETCKSEGLPSAAKIKEHKLPKRSNVGSSKHRSRVTDSAKHGRGSARGGKKSSKSKEKHVGLSGQVANKEERHSLAAGTVSGEINVEANDIYCNLGRNSNCSTFVSDDVFSSVMLPMGNNETLTKSCDGLEMQCLQPRVAWVRCDDCFKWRCISAALADEIEETNCKWTCKDNTDKAFADCVIPQEKSNAEINAELEISDASCEEDSCSARPSSKGVECRQLAASTASQQATWTLIKNNLFLHRSRKNQTIDEVMVCHCKSRLDGSLGCRDECLNRMLNIECVQGTCPCGDLCSNQQFQKRKYAKFEWFRCGKKGFGLQLQENVSQGAFLIEYVGEVLDLHAYEARQKEYAARGQKHFYFMTLNGSEVIDACAKGNLGRFINHSCDPNCRTEKWMVNGEVCIGLFAIRDIKKGEEVTFDYNYVRVFGAAAKKCVCGSSECRGYIGGDPQHTEVIVQGDSDDEYPEPVMVHEDGDNDLSMNDMILNTGSLDVATIQHVEISSGMIDTVIKSSPSVQPHGDALHMQDSLRKYLPHIRQSETSKTQDSSSKSFPSGQRSVDSLQEEDSMGKSSPAAPHTEISFESEDTMSKSLSAVQPCEVSSETANAVGRSLSVSVEDKSKSASGAAEKKPDLSKCPIMKSRSSGTIKKIKCSAKPVIPNKPKRLVDGTGRGHFEGVEQKLNELLDADGGISKRKDATKGYLKLLFVTAASGDHVHTEASHSTRDLSLVLDALLKTKSRVVLVDIVNKNGLQMLHNIMKQNRRKFNKIPIIRKLLKVLEFLALKEVLTLEHINTAPPCAGMESFKESIIALTWHSDVQVHQIARSFRDKWIPRTIRQFYSDRDGCRLESLSGNCNRFSVSHKRWHGQGSRHSDAIHCVSQTIPASVLLDAGSPGVMSPLPSQLESAAPSTENMPTDGTKKTRKRKSRWDQPAETNPNPQPLLHVKDQTTLVNSNFKTQASPSQLETHGEMLNQTSEWQRGDEAIRLGVNDDAPPGFSSPFKNPRMPTDVSSAGTHSICPPQLPQPSGAYEVVTAHPQARFLGHLHVSFGIPLALVQQLGTHKEAGEGWVIGPGMPFHSFPPLPSYPRGQTKPAPVQSSVSNRNRVTNGVIDAQQAGVNRADSINACVGSNESPPEVAANGANDPQTVERVRRASDSLGRRFFRQQKWNRRDFRYCPPWLRPRNSWGFKGNNHVRSGVASIEYVRNGANECGNRHDGSRSQSPSSSMYDYQQS